jgi:methylated-DNA-[protein]-cysteine S-methyltransferase
VSELAWGTLGSPVGQLSVACSAAGLAKVCFGPPPARAARTDRKGPRPTPISAAAAITSDDPADPGFSPPTISAKRAVAGNQGHAGRDRRQAAARARAGAAPAQPEGADGEPAAAHRQLERARTQLGEYFAGQRRAFDLPVDWPGMSAAQRQVLPVLLASAAYGETVTYGALARRAGLADGGQVPAARVTGQIMGSNPCPIIVPCHRVVAGDGLGGYSGGAGIEIKRWLLIFEGALPPTLDWDPAGPAGPGTG